MTSAWLTGALVAVTVAHVALLLVVLWARGLGGGGPDPDVYRHEEGLECAGCGTLNDEDFRYCKRCVSELPGRAGRRGSGSSPDGSRTH